MLSRPSAETTVAARRSFLAGCNSARAGSNLRRPRFRFPKLKLHFTSWRRSIVTCWSDWPRSVRQGAFRSIIEAWFYALEEDVLSGGKVDPNDAGGILAATNQLMEKRLEGISKTAPAFAAALRAYRTAIAEGNGSIADGLLAWLAGQPTVAASIKRVANIKGEVDHFTALSFLQALLLVLRDSGHPGLVLVLDEGRRRSTGPCRCAGESVERLASVD